MSGFKDQIQKKKTFKIKYLKFKIIYTSIYLYMMMTNSTCLLEKEQFKILTYMSVQQVKMPAADLQVLSLKPAGPCPQKDFKNAFYG